MELHVLANQNVAGLKLCNTDMVIDGARGDRERRAHV